MNELILKLCAKLPKDKCNFILASDLVTKTDPVKHAELLKFLTANEYKYVDYENQRDMCSFMENCRCNQHHFTPSFTWNVLRKSVFKMLGIPTNDEHLYRTIGYNMEIFHDLTFHEQYDQGDFELHLYNQNAVVRGQHLAAIRSIQDTEFSWYIPTEYHRLFKGSHQACLLKNNNLKNGRHLFLLTDSMSIPLVPILSYYFESILNFDPRSPIHEALKKSYKDIVDEFPATDFLSIMQLTKYTGEDPTGFFNLINGIF